MTGRTDESDLIKRHYDGQLDRSLTIFVLLGVAMLVATIRSLSWGDAAPKVPPSLVTVNPNVAPWWELTVLPRIGESTARRIVSYRESASGGPLTTGVAVAFRRPADLTRVSGIGPKTVQRVARYLRFDGG